MRKWKYMNAFVCLLSYLFKDQLREFFVLNTSDLQSNEKKTLGKWKK